LDILRNYHKEYDEKNKTYKDRPCHDWSSHGADAFRTLAVGYKEIRIYEQLANQSNNKPAPWR
jgi:hypothetical protein